MKALSTGYWIIRLPYQQNRILAETPKTAEGVRVLVNISSALGKVLQN